MPVLQEAETPDVPAIVEEIRSQCSVKDRELVDFLLGSLDGRTLDRDFYLECAGKRNRFIREFFSFDRKLRNAKVSYLNSRLGRPEGTDLVLLSDDEDPGFGFDEAAAASAVLSQPDILERERGLDRMVRGKVDELNNLDVLNLDLILGFLVKLRQVERWQKLDPATGREIFRDLVKEIRKTKE